MRGKIRWETGGSGAGGEGELRTERREKEGACFSARDVPRLPRTRLNSPNANTPIPVTREALYSTELFAEFIYSLVTPRKLAEETLRKRRRDREPVR